MNNSVRLKPIEEKLSLKQSRFIDNYLKYGNATQAAKESGYSHHTATRIGSENVLKLDKHITQRLKQFECDQIADADEVLRFLTSVVRGEIVDENLSFGLEGKEFRGDTVSLTKDRNKAAELLGKRYRLFVDRIEAEVDSEITVKMDKELQDWSK